MDRNALIDRNFPCARAVARRASVGAAMPPFLFAPNTLSPPRVLSGTMLRVSGDLPACDSSPRIQTKHCPMKFTLPAILATLLFSSLHAADPEPPKGFRAIFNGKDLAGWYGLNPHASAKLTGEKLAANLRQQR